MVSVKSRATFLIAHIDSRLKAAEWLQQRENLRSHARFCAGQPPSRGRYGHKPFEPKSDQLHFSFKRADDRLASHADAEERFRRELKIAVDAYHEGYDDGWERGCEDNARRSARVSGGPMRGISTEHLHVADSATLVEGWERVSGEDEHTEGE